MDAHPEDCLMTDKQKQIDKIRKLLALAAQSSNDGESSNAFSRARRYMAHYGLTMDDVYGKADPTSSNSAETERYRRDAENARQQAEQERKAREKERRAREEAEKKNSQYEADERQRRDTENIRKQAEKKARERQEAEEHARKAEVDAQAARFTATPPRPSYFERFKKDKFSQGVALMAIVLGFSYLMESTDESVQDHEPQAAQIAPSAESTPVPVASAPVASVQQPSASVIKIVGYDVDSQKMRYCVSDDMSDPTLLSVRQVVFANDHSVIIDDKHPVQFTELVGRNGYRMANGDTITLSKNAVINGMTEGGRKLTCYATQHIADQEVQLLLKREQARAAREQAQIERERAPVAPPRPDPFKVYEYSINSHDRRTCLLDGSQQDDGKGGVNYRTVYMFFVSASEVGFGDDKSTSGIRVVESEGRGMYKLENGDEIGVDIMGGVSRYFNKKYSLTCFTTPDELTQYLRSHPHP